MLSQCCHHSAFICCCLFDSAYHYHLLWFSSSKKRLVLWILKSILLFFWIIKCFPQDHILQEQSNWEIVENIQSFFLWFWFSTSARLSKVTENALKCFQHSRTFFSFIMETWEQRLMAKAFSLRFFTYPSKKQPEPREPCSSEKQMFVSWSIHKLQTLATTICSAPALNTPSISCAWVWGSSPAVSKRYGSEIGTDSIVISIIIPAKDVSHLGWSEQIGPAQSHCTNNCSSIAAPVKYS